MLLVACCKELRGAGAGAGVITSRESLGRESSVGETRFNYMMSKIIIKCALEVASVFKLIRINVSI